MTSAIAAYLTKRYGKFMNPMPSIDTLAKDFPFVPRQQREGASYDFPIRLGLPGGVTFDDTNTAFPTKSPIAAVFKSASVTGSSILVQDDVPYNDVFATMNGISDGGGQGGAYFDKWDEATEGVMLTAEVYREIQLLAGPGPTSTAAASIGTVSASVSGANLAAPQVVNITKSTWRPGLFQRLIGHLFDVYQSDGTTLRASGVTLQAVVDSTNRLQLFKTGSAATVAANDIILPASSIDVSCYGIEAIAANTGSLFGIDAGVYPQWKVSQFAVGGALTRAKILGALATLKAKGVRDGGTLYVSAPCMADLIEEANTLVRFTPQAADKPDVRVQGTSRVEYATQIGLVVVKTHDYFQQGLAFFNPNKNGGIRVGQTDNTFTNGKNEMFLQELENNAGSRIRCFSHQAPLLPLPHQCMRFTGIVSTYDSAPA
ncbi:MAG TPA: hypothetical protein VHM19_22870 [Polyangiales bacterium]|jgi:hypothetical protein|nr:hypothetical protein [Polyangiales bacterium]